MMKSSYQLPCLLGDDSCQFTTIQLEFPQAKEILQMHMKLVHPVPDLRRFECVNCEKDYSTKDIIELKMKPVVMFRMKLHVKIPRFPVIIQIHLRVYKLPKLSKLLRKMMKLHYNQISPM